MSSDKDLAIGAIGGGQGVPAGAIYAGGLPQASTISRKPCYLITLDGLTKTGKPSVRRFVAIEKPGLEAASVIQVKGFYAEETEDEIVSNFLDIIKAVPKDAIMEIIFPTHKVHSIRSLVFNANKLASVIK